MTSLADLLLSVKNEGYNEANAEAKVCQDIVLRAISASTLNRNITIKGGVVMRSITGNTRRATQDMDLDFIRYSLSEASIQAFIDKLNCIDGITIKINGGIEELSQQEYRGKRVFIEMSDRFGNSFMSKIDMGVHKNVQIEQEEYCFDVCLDDVGASLLINSKEQIFTEKLRSLLRFGPISTRYKDVFDLCYLADHVDTEKLLKCMDTYILLDPNMRENEMKEVIKRISRTFSDRLYKKNIERAKLANWLDIPVSVAFDKILSFLGTL